MSPEDTLPFHHWLLADSDRTTAYRRALNQIVRKDDVVLDIGAGSGILSFFAALSGARKVYGIEIGEALLMAREICAGNGFNGKIEFRQGRSQDIELPELVDVVVSDTGCSFGLQGGILGILLDAKKRFLKLGGTIIPRSLQLMVAPVELKDRRNLDIWNRDRYGVDLSAIRPYAANTDYYLTLRAEDILAVPALLTTINFATVSSTYVAGETVSVAAQNGVMHGLGAWIELELAPGVSFSNTPLGPTVNWAQNFFPIETPVAINSGDLIRSKIQTNNGIVWQWEIEITGENCSGSSSVTKGRFDQSTLRKFPVDVARFKKQFPSYQPKLSRMGEAEVHLMSRFDGRRTALELEEEMFGKFSDCFRSKEAVSEFVARVISRRG